MDYSPWSERKIWSFLKVAISPKPEKRHPPKYAHMHVSSTSTCINFLSQFQSIKIFDDHGLLTQEAMPTKFWGHAYSIAGNFRGSKLLRIHPKIIFTLIFANFIIQPFCTVLFIISRFLFSQISKNHKKSESYWPQKFPAIRYLISFYLQEYLSEFHFWPHGLQSIV